MTSAGPIPADLTVVAGGRRSTLPDWLAAIGADPVPEEVEDTGIVYYSRFYELLPGAEPPPRDGPIGGDLGYLKYAIFQGDNGTFSVTLATPTDDGVLRTALSTIAAFDATAALLPATKAWVDPAISRPITGVHLMAGLLNRCARSSSTGRPLALGVHAIGDASVCTNPLYGRGCSTGFWHADLLAGVVRDHRRRPHGPGARAARAHRGAPAAVVPVVGRAGRRGPPHRGRAARRRGLDDPNDPRAFMRSVLREGLAPAMRTDPEVFRAFVRTFNLLVPPDTLISDPDIGARVLAVWNDRENRPPEPVLGPRTARPARGARARCLTAGAPPAGMIDTVSPSGTGVSSPAGSARRRRRRRGSRTGAGCPHRRRCDRGSPGCAASRLSSTSERVAPSTLTSATPPVAGRSVVGTRTVTLIGRAA